MKFIVIVVCLMFPVVATAQNQSMNGGDMGKMMQLMQEMQVCMEKIDQAELEIIEKQSEEMETELEALCKNGKRKKAQEKAVAFSKKLLNNPAMVQMKKCGEITKGVLPENAMPSFDQEFEFSGRHVCDE